jgi:hypothetical protein
MINLTALREFLREAAYYRGLPQFEPLERIYKLRLTHDLQEAAVAMRKDVPDALELFVRALRSPDDNLINWRDQPLLIRWIRSGSQARTALLRLWDTTQPLNTRLRRAEAILRAAGLTKPGSQLTVVSTLLMVVSPYDHPPVRTQPFRKVFREFGLPAFATSDALPARYNKAMAFLDDLVANSGALLRDRLDAQSVVWCIYSWPPVPTDFKPPNDIDGVSINAIPTEQIALHLARRGQGRFRDDLWRIWGGCALTLCRVPELVQAAHIKPWRESTDAERLDPHNGLLLLPTVHAALDARLITFDPDNGEIIMSNSLSREDAAAMGVRSGMRLSKIPERTRIYLQHHANAFRARARS